MHKNEFSGFFRCDLIPRSHVNVENWLLQSWESITMSGVRSRGFPLMGTDTFFTSIWFNPCSFVNFVFYLSIVSLKLEILYFVSETSERFTRERAVERIKILKQSIFSVNYELKLAILKLHFWSESSGRAGSGRWSFWSTLRAAASHKNIKFYLECLSLL